MAISKQDLQNALLRGKEIGQAIGKEETKRELLATRQLGIIELVNAAALLAKANASLTYSISRIADKLL